MRSLLLLSFVIMTTLMAEDKEFVIAICSYNNKRWFKQNLDSVFCQTYQNYHIFYIDDCSQDGTADEVQTYVNNLNMQDKVTIIRNAKRRRALANHYHIIHKSAGHKIIVQLDGDDWFADDQVLERLNQVYQNPGVWITLGNFRDWSKGVYRKRICRPINARVMQKKSYRYHVKGPYHPRTFYAWLAQKIKLKDLLFCGKQFSGDFFPAVYDWALMYPMLEMAGNRVRFLSDFLYVYNVQTPLNDFKIHKELIALSRKQLVRLSRYPYLKKESSIMKEQKAIIFTTKDGLRKECIGDDIPLYEIPEQCTARSIEHMITMLCEEHKSTYIVFALQPAQVIECLDIDTYVRLLEQTGAHGFYCTFASNDCSLLHAHPLPGNEGVYFWQYNKSTIDPRESNFFIIKKNNIYDFLKYNNSFTIEEFKNKLHQRRINGIDIGLFLGH